MHSNIVVLKSRVTVWGYRKRLLRVESPLLTCSSLPTRFFALSLTGTFSGNAYTLARIRRYVDLTSVDSYGGRPMSIVYRITPADHKST